MFTLIRKDLLLNRVPIIGNAIVVLAVYAIVVLVNTTSPRPVRFRDWLDSLAAASVAGICITCAIAAVYGGVAFAQERRERSANFLAMMPLRRRPILISKLIVSWALLLSFVFLNTIGLSIVVLLMSQTEYYYHRPLVWREIQELVFAVVTGGAITFMLFGVAWLFSVLLESPSVAACIAWGAATMVNLTIVLIVQHFEYPEQQRDELAVLLCSSFSFVIGVGCFILGTIHYLTRTEP